MPGISVLGLGCSALLGRAGRAESLTALGAAVDAGITFFDTARSYGYGESETLLGEFFAGGSRTRQQVVLCTKFGILPGAKGGWKQRMKPLAQAVVKAVPALRGMARRQAAGQIAANQFSVEVLHSSLEASLRELRTDYVDMLLMHGAPMSVLAQDDLLGALERLVESGKVRMAGISGELDVIGATFARRPAVLRTAQFALNLGTLAFAEEARRVAGEMLLVGNHPFGGPVGVAATQARIAALASDAALPETLRAKLREGAGDRQMFPEILLNVLLRGTGLSAIVPAMMQVKNLRSNVAAVERCRFTDEELAAMRVELSRADFAQGA